MRVKAGFGVELGSVNSNLEQHGCQDHLVRITRATVAETTAGSRESLFRACRVSFKISIRYSISSGPFQPS